MLPAAIFLPFYHIFAHVYAMILIYILKYSLFYKLSNDMFYLAIDSFIYELQLK